MPKKKPPDNNLITKWLSFILCAPNIKITTYLFRVFFSVYLFIMSRDTCIRYTDHLLAVFSVILLLKPSLNWAFFRVNCYIFTWLDEFPAVYFKAKSGRVRQNSVESEKRDKIPFLVGFFSMKRWILNWFLVRFHISVHYLPDRRGLFSLFLDFMW